MTPETYRAAMAEMERTAHVDIPYSEYVAAREQWASITQPGLIAVLLAAIDAYKVDAERYRWLKANCGRFPHEYGAPHVRLGEGYDYADEMSIDSDTDNAMAEQAEHARQAVKTEG